MKAYKGFDKDLKCRGFQYEIGKEYEEKEAEACEKGFHACENPLEVFRYYPPCDGNRYCEVEQDGELSKHGGDSKVEICDKAIELIDLLANMPLADDEFVDEIIDGIRYNEPYRIETIRDEVQNG